MLTAISKRRVSAAIRAFERRFGRGGLVITACERVRRCREAARPFVFRFGSALSALRGGVDDVVPVGVLWQSASPELDVVRDFQPFAQGLGLALSGLVVVLREDDGPEVGKETCGAADLFALASRGAPAQRNSPVEKAEVSERAKAKADTKLTPPTGCRSTASRPFLPTSVH